MSEPRESSAGGIVHPEWVNGRRIWMDSAMSDLIHRLHYGDPVKGWEGDERLAVYYNPPRWELWRLEHDEVYRMVCRSGEGIPFDERVIDALVQWDRRRRTVSLHDEVVDHNAAIDRERTYAARDFLENEAAPRLAAALARENR